MTNIEHSSKVSDLVKKGLLSKRVGRLLIGNFTDLEIHKFSGEFIGIIETPGLGGMACKQIKDILAQINLSIYKDGRRPRELERERRQERRIALRLKKQTEKLARRRGELANAEAQCKERIKRLKIRVAKEQEALDNIKNLGVDDE